MKGLFSGLVLAALCGPAPAPVQAAQKDPPAALVASERVDLGPVYVQLHSYDRWGRTAVTAEGCLLVLYATPDRKIVYRLSKDGRAFGSPIPVAPGTYPAAALDSEGNIHLAFQNARGRIGMMKLRRTGPGQWEAGSQATEPFARFGAGPAQLPTLLIERRSGRVWCLYNYQPVDLAAVARAHGARPKPRTDPVISYSDDGGRTWAEPEYVGSDSGDIGTGMVVLRGWRGQPAWFWSFWDCAPPAWGFFDGSRSRGLREFFPHTKYRTACWHPWDALEDHRGRLCFATGLDYQTRGQLCKTFDGSGWSAETFLSDSFGVAALLDDGQHTFCVVSEGANKPRGKRLAVYQLEGSGVVRRPVAYTAPEGRLIHRVYAPGDARAKGYVPLFLAEETPQPQQGPKPKFIDPRLVYLRLEVKPLDTAGAEGGKSLLDLERVPAAQRALYKPLPVNDTRTEPRTDTPKDRRLVRVGPRWVLIYADDNPGRLLAAPVAAGKVGKPAVLVDKPGWGRFQCSAAADGDDALAAVCPEDEGVLVVRLSGIKTWDTSGPKVSRTFTKFIQADKQGPSSAQAEPPASWPTLCKLPDGRFLVVAVRDGALATAVLGANGQEGVACPNIEPRTANPRPCLLTVDGNAVLLVGGSNGIWCRRWLGEAWSQAEQTVRDPWVGHHFSATSSGGKVDLVYAPAESYLGRRVIGHVRLDGGEWKPMPPVDRGRVARGLSLCDLGGGRLLCAYAVRNDRPEEPAQGAERMRRFTYALYQKTFDGRSWQGEGVPVAWPEVPDYRPEEWQGYNRFKGVVYMPATQRGMFPVLPAAAGGQAGVPVVWSVPGFHCITRYWFPQDRGGLLLGTEIKLN